MAEENSQEKFIEIKNLIEGAQLSLQQARDLLASLTDDTDNEFTAKAQTRGSKHHDGTGQVIEGVFNGQHMIGPDGKQYSVPANYASKSKLIEGDLLKLTIDRFGNFLYKQIGPMDRTRLRGVLKKDEKSGEWRVLAEGKSYMILLASVTYFKGEENDQVVILVPKDRSSSWAAVENIIKESDDEFDAALAGSSEHTDSNEDRKQAFSGLHGPLSGSVGVSSPIQKDVGSQILSEPSTAQHEHAYDESVSETKDNEDDMEGMVTPSHDMRRGIGGNVPAYSPEPDDVITTNPLPSLAESLNTQTSPFSDNISPQQSFQKGYQEIKFDDDSDEFQEI